MKICPQCQTTYTDDSLQFCLQDGTPLVAQSVSQNWSDAETLVSPKYATNKMTDQWGNPINIPLADSHDQLFPTEKNAAPQKSKTGLIIALTALVTLVVIGAAIAGFMFYQRRQTVEIAQNTNTNFKSLNAANNGNQKANANANAANVTATPTATPSAKPTLAPKEVETLKSDVRNTLDDWKNSTENHDLEAHLRNYADTVDYYNAGKVGIAKVRADREKAFDMYNDMQVTIDNVKITPDPGGDKAVVTLDKEWNFENEEKSNSGKVQQQLIFGKIGGAWRITGEKDLKVYYVNK